MSIAGRSEECRYCHNFDQYVCDTHRASSKHDQARLQKACAVASILFQGTHNLCEMQADVVYVLSGAVGARASSSRNHDGLYYFDLRSAFLSYAAVLGKRNPDVRLSSPVRALTRDVKPNSTDHPPIHDKPP